jgi:dTDP-4-amino-4,6-dideoxygalactose transaminase
MIDLPAEHAAYRQELSEAIEAVLRHGQFILGPEVAAFEEEVGAYLGVPFAVSCNSGTDALVLALRALGIGAGHEVVTTPWTFFATAEAISVVGAVPVFVDIDEATYNIDAEQVAAAVTARTRAVMPVHLYGQPADLDPLLAVAAEHGAAVVEDTAQAFGAVYGERQAGTLGACGAYSFFPTKPLGGLGDGGMVVTSDPAVADRLRMLRVHGARRRYANEMVGYNSRLDTVQAAVLRLKLRRVDDANKARQRVAQQYDERFEGVKGLVTPFVAPGRTHVYHVYTVRILGGRRDAVREALERRGIASMVYYPVPVHRLPVYTGQAASLPRAERAAAEVLSLPISPVLGEDAVDAVADTVLGALTGAG